MVPSGWASVFAEPREEVQSGARFVHFTAPAQPLLFCALSCQKFGCLKLCGGRIALLHSCLPEWPGPRYLEKLHQRHRAALVLRSPGSKCGLSSVSDALGDSLQRACAICNPISVALLGIPWLITVFTASVSIAMS